MEISNETLIVKGVYRLPNNKEPLFLDFYKQLIDNNYITGSNAILTGNFNINLLDNSVYKERLLNISMSGGLKQIHRPTRCIKTFGTLVDHLYTNIAYSKETNREYGMMGDQEVIGTELRTSTETKKCFFIRRGFSEKKINELSLDLSEQNWNNTSCNIDVIYQNLMSNI
ncbi:hypothetical protein HHI36_001758, partial [Cryptolaemus montrouzieri]